MTFIIFCLSINWMKEVWGKTLLRGNTQTKLHRPCTSRQMLNKSVNCRHVRYKSCEAVSAGCSFRERGAGTHKPVWQTHWNTAFPFTAVPQIDYAFHKRQGCDYAPEALQILFCILKPLKGDKCDVRRAGAKVLGSGTCSHPEQAQAVYIWPLNLILI